MRPVTIWKGNSFTTISARDPHISGKDSGKGDSDFNDSDSDISGDVHKKESPPTNSECRTLAQRRTNTRKKRTIAQKIDLSMRSVLLSKPMT